MLFAVWFSIISSLTAPRFSSSAQSTSMTNISSLSSNGEQQKQQQQQNLSFANFFIAVYRFAIAAMSAVATHFFSRSNEFLSANKNKHIFICFKCRIFAYIFFESATSNHQSLNNQPRSAAVHVSIPFFNAWYIHNVISVFLQNVSLLVSTSEYFNTQNTAAFHQSPFHFNLIIMLKINVDTQIEQIHDHHLCAKREGKKTESSAHPHSCFAHPDDSSRSTSLISII